MFSDKRAVTDVTDRAYSRIILNSPYDGGTRKRSGGLKLDTAGAIHQALEVM
jgi:hypothetical protein